MLCSGKVNTTVCTGQVFIQSHFLKISEGSCGEQNNVPPQDDLDFEYVTLHGKGAFLV